MSYEADSSHSLEGIIPHSLKDRALGCLYGQAIGDALGARYEFMELDDVQTMISADKINGHLPMLGRPGMLLAPGQSTDDTELALTLARSMLRKSTYDLADVANSYIDWINSPGFDCGVTTMQAFHGASRVSGPPEIRLEKIIRASVSQNKKSLSNGCLMRISPLAIAGSSWDQDLLMHTAKVDCFLTNPSPIAQEAVAAYVLALRLALEGQNISNVYNKIIEKTESDVIKGHLEMSKDQPEPTKITRETSGRDDFITTSDGTRMEYLGIALQNAFYAASHHTSFEDALVDIINRGGDTDTNGCIAGALLGALMGAGAIPADWKATVLGCKNAERVAENPWARLDDLETVAIKLLEVNPPKLTNVTYPAFTKNPPVFNAGV